MTLHRIPHLAAASIAGLLLLALTMFVAMVAGVEPHPPGSRGPYLGAIAALALVSLWLLLARERSGLWVGLATALAFVPAVGPHKFFTEAAAQALAPLIVVGTLCAATAVVATLRAALGRPQAGG
jgi:hypothetical protein